MRRLKKIIIYLLILVLLFIIALCGVGIYYYNNPPKIKELVEDFISRSMGVLCTIDTLSYSLRPLNINANGIVMRTGQNGKGLQVAISGINLDASREGSFGKKTLIVNNVAIDGLSINITKDLEFQRVSKGDNRDSFVNSFLRRFFEFFMFKSVRLEKVLLIGGEANASLGDIKAHGDSIRVYIGNDHLLNMDMRFEIVSLKRNMRMNIPDLKISTETAISFHDRDVKGSLTASNLEFKMSDISVQESEIEALFLYNATNNSIEINPISLNIQGLEAVYKAERINFPEKFNIKAEGIVDIRNRKLDFPVFKLLNNDLMEFESSLKAASNDHIEAEIQIKEGKFRPETVRPVLPLRIKQALEQVTLDGPVSFLGRISAISHNGNWHLEGNLENRFKENPYKYDSGDLELSGMLTGKLTLKGEFPDIVSSAEVISRKTIVSGSRISADPSVIELSISGNYPRYQLKTAELRCPWAKMPVKEKEIGLKDIDVIIRNGNLDVRNQSFDFSDIRFNSSRLRNIILGIRKDGKELHTSAGGKDTNIIKVISENDLLSPGWKIEGQDEWMIKLNKKEKEVWEYVSDINLDAVSFQDPKGLYFGENMAIRGVTEGIVRPDNRNFTVDVDLGVESGELLLDNFYFDLANNGFSIKGKGAYGSTDKRFGLSGFTLELYDVLKMTIDGDIMAKNGGFRTDVDVAIPEIPIKPVFKNFIFEPYKAKNPILKDIEPGGSISADLSLDISKESRDVSANLRWREGTLHLKDKDINLEDIELDLPVFYHKGTDIDNKMSRTGRLFIGQTKLPFLSPQPIDLTLKAEKNRLISEVPLMLEIPGGDILLGKINIENLFSPERTLNTDIRIDIRDTSPLISKFIPGEIEGSIKGTLDDVKYKDYVLSTHGELVGDLFQGEIRLHDLTAYGLFTPAPVLRLDAEWKNLLLSELTANTKFGKVEGILNGYVKDLEFAYGQPQRFELLMETVKTPHIPQRISVQAVENIARIGGGQSPFIGMASIMTSFIKEFSYSKMGVFATLENDIFRIHGTIREGGKEYLIKRGGFPSVDVVNQNPDNGISFKDMVKRISRVTSSERGPVIK